MDFASTKLRIVEILLKFLSRIFPEGNHRYQNSDLGDSIDGTLLQIIKPLPPKGFVPPP
jgi:hypothetical protein